MRNKAGTDHDKTSNFGILIASVELDVIVRKIRKHVLS